jgi:hypothetical protein
LDFARWFSRTPNLPGYLWDRNLNADLRNVAQESIGTALSQEMAETEKANHFALAAACPAACRNILNQRCEG